MSEMDDIKQQIETYESAHRIAEGALDKLSMRIAELERQRDAVLELHQPMPHDPTRCGICHQADQSCGCCGSWDENDRWPCKTVEIYGGGQ